MTTIQEVLDHCLEDITSGTASAEQCLARYPQYASELRPLLLTAARLGAVNEVRPTRAFKSQLRRQLAGEPEGPRRRFFTFWMFVVWAVIALVVAGFAIWMGIEFEVAGRSSRPVPVNFENPSAQARVVFLVSSALPIESNAAGSLYSPGNRLSAQGQTVNLILIPPNDNSRWKRIERPC